MQGQQTTKLVAVTTVMVVALFALVRIWATQTQFSAADSCDPSSLGEQYGPISAIYQVDGGRIGLLCYGSYDPQLDTAWNSLAAMTTPAERVSLQSFALFDGTGAAAAYTQQLDPEATEFTIAVSRSVAQGHPQVLRHVMAHEFAHVLTSHQSNIFTGAPVPTAECLTAENPYGCVGWNNHLATWTHQFWRQPEIDALHSDGYRNQAEAARRCAADPGFPGEYSATNPGEDYAESFASYVLSVRVPAANQPRMSFMASDPRVVAIRDRVHAAGLSAPDLILDRCG